MATERIYVFQHVECETLGTFAERMANRAVRADYVRLFAGESVPDDTAAAAALIFLGGPMSVNDEARYPYLAVEKATIRSALRAGQPVLGVCLGAQLLAAAAGARVFPGARPEIGWEPVSLTMEGRLDAVVSSMAQLAAVFHWHGETFDLPQGAARLAFSALTINQAFRLGRAAYGLQFHLEVDAAMIQSWFAAYPNDLGADPDAARRRITADTGQYAQPLQASANEAMDRFLDLIAPATRPGT
jgi:GMP synthase (glutamine-hydrolysing)